MTYANATLRAPRAAPGLAPGFTRRLARSGWVALGVVIVLAGAAIGALPGPGGIPIVTVGLVMILKNSRGARRLFIHAQRRWPATLTPVRRALKDPRQIGPLLTAPFRAVGRWLAAASALPLGHRTVAPAP